MAAPDALERSRWPGSSARLDARGTNAPRNWRYCRAIAAPHLRQPLSFDVGTTAAGHALSARLDTARYVDKRTR
jgi:hypothetical protein